MCLGIPGKITAISAGPLPMGTVDYSGHERTCSLMYLPEAVVGDYVLVQNKLAMTLLTEDEAKECFKALDDLDIKDALQTR